VIVDDRNLINRYLGNRGLSTLEDPASLIPQLGFLVEDHDHFRRVLMKCKDERERQEMYEAMRPHLRFEPKSLYVYIKEAGLEAEAQQLPTVDAEGNFHAYRSAQIRTIERLVDERLTAFHLSVTCRKCTKAATFHGYSKRDALDKLRSAGWTWDELNGDGLEICPDCPAVRD
jgi:hypothetical protein